MELGADYQGKSFDTVYNPDYVVDYLKAVNDEKVEFHFRDKTTAGVFRSGKDYIYVLMPLTVSL